MYLNAFDSVPAFQGILNDYNQWWDPWKPLGGNFRTTKPGTTFSGIEFYNKNGEFYSVFYAHDVQYGGGQPPNPLTYPGPYMADAFNIQWEAFKAVDYITNFKILPPFITSSNVWRADQESQRAYGKLLSGPIISLDDAGIAAESIFAKVINIYESWLNSSLIDDDMGVLVSYDTRIKSTHYWALHFLFLELVGRCIPPPTPPPTPPTPIHPGMVDLRPHPTDPDWWWWATHYIFIPPTPAPFPMEEFSKLQNRVSLLEKEMKKPIVKKAVSRKSQKPGKK